MLTDFFPLQLFLIVVGFIFFLISIYVLIRGIKRDKIISVSVVMICFLLFILTIILSNNNKDKTTKYFGTYELIKYNNSNEFKIEICPNQNYLIYNKSDTILKGKWEYQSLNTNLDFLLIDGEIFGLGELEIKNKLLETKKASK